MQAETNGISKSNDIQFSILDNDLYKFTMQQCVMQHFPDIEVTYAYTNRTKDMKFTREAFEWLQTRFEALSELQLTDDEHAYLSTYSFFTPDYLAYLRTFRFKPSEQIHFSFDDATSELILIITGPWVNVILYEVPLLALISECYFRIIDRCWTCYGQFDRAYNKATQLLHTGCKFSEFGTRRRRDFLTQDTVLKAFVKASTDYKTSENNGEGEFTGTSNVLMAYRYGVRAVGTMAHEIYMAMSALKGLEHVNAKTLNIWHETYKGALGIALTDTFTTRIFFDDFDLHLANLYDGVRHDSGDTKTFTDKTVAHYKKLGIDPSTKSIIYSDNLTTERCIDLNAYAKMKGIKTSFGIGTYFTNDFERTPEGGRSMPMNIVIKLKEVAGMRVVKLSDDVTKTSDGEEVGRVKSILGL